MSDENEGYDFDHHLLTEMCKSDSFQTDLTIQFIKASDNQIEVEEIGKRSLNKEKTLLYLQQLSDEDYHFVFTIIENTLYIPDNVLTEKLINLALEFLKNYRRKYYYIVLNRWKTESMVLMIIKVFNILNTPYFKGFITDETILPENSRVLIIDDASYSGNNLETYIDSISYINKTVNIHVLIPYISNFMFNVLPKTYSNVVKFFKSITVLKTINEIIKPENIKDYLYDRFEAVDKLVDFHEQLLLYFDHTVASKDSSFPTIYLRGIIPGKKDYGILINYLPNKSIRKKVYLKYFKNLLPSNI